MMQAMVNLQSENHTCYLCYSLEAYPINFGRIENGKFIPSKYRNVIISKMDNAMVWFSNRGNNYLLCFDKNDLYLRNNDTQQIIKVSGYDNRNGIHLTTTGDFIKFTPSKIIIYNNELTEIMAVEHAHRVCLCDRYYYLIYTSNNIVYVVDALSYDYYAMCCDLSMKDGVYVVTGIYGVRKNYYDIKSIIKDFNMATRRLMSSEGVSNGSIST